MLAWYFRDTLSPSRANVVMPEARPIIQPSYASCSSSPKPDQNERSHTRDYSGLVTLPPETTTTILR
jgi:hypothetical protein